MREREGRKEERAMSTHNMFSLTVQRPQDTSISHGGAVQDRDSTSDSLSFATHTKMRRQIEKGETEMEEWQKMGTNKGMYGEVRETV